jgi:hypothetical protein
MTIDTTPKETPTGKVNPTAGDAINNHFKYPTDERGDKAFVTLRAAFAIEGHALYRTDPKNGPVTFWAERWGMVKYLPTIDAARRFLHQIGGRL